MGFPVPQFPRLALGSSHLQPPGAEGLSVVAGAPWCWGWPQQVTDVCNAPRARFGGRIWVSGTGGTGGFLGAAKRCEVLTSTRCALCLSWGGDDDPREPPHGLGACGVAGFWHGHCPLCCTSVVVGTRGQSSSAQGQERMEAEENPRVCALGSGTNATSWSFGFFGVIVTAAVVSLRVVRTGSSAQDPWPEHPQPLPQLTGLLCGFVP